MMPTSSELRAALAAHEANRPDVLKATDPASPKWMYAEWEKWCERKRRIQTQITLALADEENVWRDASGNVVKRPIVWVYGHSDIHHIESRQAEAIKRATKKAEEMRLYRERKAQGLLKMNGRPRSENPSPEAIRKREARERAREAA